MPQEIVRFGSFVLDGCRCELRFRERVVKLRPRPMALLWYLIENRSRVVSPRELHEHVWKEVAVGDAAIATAVRALRVALDDDEKTLIRTLRGHGYRFTAHVTVVDSGRPAPGSDAPTTPPALRSFEIVSELVRSALERAGVSARLLFVDVSGDPSSPWVFDSSSVPLSLARPATRVSCDGRLNGASLVEPLEKRDVE